MKSEFQYIICVTCYILRLCVIKLSEMLGGLIGAVRLVKFSDSQIIGIVGLSDSQTVNLLEMSDRLIRIVGMVGFSDSRTVRFSELLDNWIVGQSDSWIVWQSDCWNCQNCQIIKIVGLLICQKCRIG